MPDIFAALPAAVPLDRPAFHVLMLWILGNLVFLGIWAYVYARYAWLTFEIAFFAQHIWLPIFFMFPFAYSDFNWVALGAWYWRVRPFLDEAFLQAFTGAVFTGIGYLLSRKLKVQLPGIGLVYRSVNRAWITSAGMGIGIATIAAFLLIFTAMGLQPFNARGSAILDRSILPVYNFFQIFTQFITLCALAYFYATRKWIGLVCILAAAFAGIYTGARGPFLFFAIQFFILYAIVTRLRRIGKAALLGAGAMVFAIYMSGWRYGEFGLTHVLQTPFLVLYGNNFSDLRDYALTLSGWDNELLLGKTFLAGFLTGLPGFSDFRGEYSWGVWVLQTALGYIMEGHPGMRPILWGEWYFNFGMPGLCLCALFYGMLVGRLADFVRTGMKVGEKRATIVAAVSAMAYWMIVSNFIATASFFTFHVIVILILLGYLASLSIRRDASRRALPA